MREMVEKEEIWKSVLWENFISLTDRDMKIPLKKPIRDGSHLSTVSRHADDRIS